MKKSYLCSCLVVLMLFVAVDCDAFRAGRHGVNKQQANMKSRMVSRRAQRLFKPSLVIKQNKAGTIQSMALDSSEELLAVAMEDGNIRVWSLTYGRQIKSFKADANVKALKIDEDNRYLLYLSDGIVRCRQMSDDSEIFQRKVEGEVLDFWIHGPRLYVLKKDSLDAYDLKGGNSVAYGLESEIVYGRSDDASYIYMIDRKGIVSKYDIIQNSVAIHSKSYGRPDHVSISADSRYAALKVGKEIKVVDTTTMQLSKAIPTNRRGVDFIRCNDSGTTFLVSDGDLVEYSHLTGQSGKTVFKDKNDIQDVLLSKDSQYALLATKAGIVELVNIPARQVQIRLLMTKTGWMAVNDQGGFDGSPQAVNDVHWEDGDVSVPVSAFSSSHYMPGVLNRGFNVVVAQDMSRIVDGVQMPPLVKTALVKTTNDGMAVVDVTVENRSDGPVEAVSGFRNGKVITAESKRMKEDDTSFTDRYSVALSKGRNVLDFVAYNSEGLESPVARVVVNHDAPESIPTAHVITIGIDRYSNSKMDLNFAVADSMGIADFWKTAKTSAQKTIVEYRVNKSATRTNIINAIRFLQAVPKEDMAFIFLAGHGLVHESEWYFVPHEYDIDQGMGRLKDRGVSSSDLQVLLESLGPDRVFLAIDACYSGASVDSLSSFSGLKTLRLLSRSVGVCILSGAARDQFAVEIDELGHGAFSYSLLEGLAGMADSAPQDQQITVSEVLNYVEQEVPFLSSQFASYMQIPTSHSRGQNYILLQKNQ